MPPTYEAGLALVTHHYKHASLQREAVITFAANNTGTPNTAQQLADALQTVWVNAIGPTTDTNVTMSRTTVLLGLGGQAFSAAVSTAVGTPGSFATSTVQSNTAALVQKRTSLGGRAGRGRVYLPWALSDGAIDEVGRITPVDTGQIQTAATAYYNGYAGSMILAHRLYDLPWSNPARQLLAVTKGPLVTALIASSIAATQRRRMPRS